MKSTDQLASAIYDTLMSPNVSDSNGEAANLVDAAANNANGLFSIAKALNRIADAMETNRGDEPEQQPQASGPEPLRNLLP